MNPILLLGIDEFTMVLTISKTKITTMGEWSNIAIKCIKKFSQMTDLENVFGKQEPLESKTPQGYTMGYQYGNNPFYFAIAYHPDNIQMGIVVKFSAYAWAYYCEQYQSYYQKPMNIKQFLTVTDTDDFHSRLSRIDFTADFQNWNFTVDDIYRHITDGSWIIKTAEGKKNPSGLSAHEINKVVETFYVGSKRGNTRLFLRVYDKYLEQMEQPSFRYEEALSVSSWVRLEAVFKGKYAHQITESIRTELNYEETALKAFIASKMLEKYRFVSIDDNMYAQPTIALVNAVEDYQFGRLRLESPRDNELVKSIRHLMKTSGLYTTMYKCDEIWGENAGMELIWRLAHAYQFWNHPSDDAIRWVNIHRKEMKKRTLQELFMDVGINQEVVQKNKKETITTPPKANSNDSIPDVEF